MEFLAAKVALIAAAVTVPTLVAMYFLKLRRKQVAVSSTVLWRKAIRDLQVNAPFQKLRRNLLLLLQLLVLAGLLTAMARPTVRGTVQAGDRVVIMIDHSASMNATDESPSRLDRAKKAALELIDSLSAGSTPGSPSGAAMVVSFAQQSQVLQPFTTDPTLLRSAVNAIQPTDQPTNFEPVSQLLEGLAARGAKGGEEGRGAMWVYLISDGRLNQERPVHLQGVNVRYVQVGKERPDNLAVVSLSARRDVNRPNRLQVLGRLANYAEHDTEANLSLKLEGQTVGASRVKVPGVGQSTVRFDFSLAESGLVELSHDHRDALSADDAAWLVLGPSRRPRVLLVTPGNMFLERVLRSLPIEALVTMTPSRYEDQRPGSLVRRGVAMAEEGFDLLVFDGYAPKAVPPVAGVFFGCAPPIAGLKLARESEGDEGATVILDWKRAHPLLRHVALHDLLIAQPGRLSLPDSARILATSSAGPIVAELTHEGVEQVVVGFSLLESTWPMQVSFPVFVDNCVNVLAGAGWEGWAMSYKPGQVAVVPGPGRAAGGEVKYEGPVTLTAKTSGSGAGPLVLPMFERVGVYRTEAPVPVPWDRLAVNLCDAGESDLRPAGELPMTGGVVTTQGGKTAIRLEVWPWFAGSALVVLMAEWVVYARRMHL